MNGFCEWLKERCESVNRDETEAELLKLLEPVSRKEPEDTEPYVYAYLPVRLIDVYEVLWPVYERARREKMSR